ncbi:MAG: tetratricopeptide repeat protein, partial [Proteobacteria bacterium]|nr:tetratricopeptide repeat protein [Pseudomonadota bacterium]
YGGVLRVLRKYLSRATPSADGRSVVFTLTGDYDLRDFDLGSAVVVDVLDRASGGAAAAPPGDAGQLGADPWAAEPKGPRVRVRSGEHKGFSRMVFDWPRKVAYEIERTGATTTITFGRPARVDIGTLGTRPSKYFRDVVSQVKDGRLIITLAVPETSRLRHFVSGVRVVVDVLAPSETENAAQAPAPAPVGAPSGDQGETSAPSGVPSAAEEKPENTAASKPIPLIPAKPTAVDPPPRAPAPDGQPRSVAAATPDPAPAGEQPATGPAPAEERPAADSGPAGEQPAAAERAPDAPPPVPGLRFEWNEPVAAAVFRRAGFLWIAFDKASQVDVEGLRAQGGNVIRTIEQIPSERATVLRLATVAGVNPEIKRDGFAWILEFRRQRIQPRTAIETKAQPNSPVGPRLFLSVPEPGRPIVLRDPEVGDTIVVVPVIPLGHGIAHTFEYPQLRILETAQGVVIQPRIDNLRVRSLRQGIEVTGPGRLQISPVTRELAANVRLGIMRPYSRVFSPQKWRRRVGESFIVHKQRLQNAVALAKDAAREKARLDLARFYFANGLGAEALGVLALVAEDRPGILDDPRFRALRGANRFLANHFAEAREDLYDTSLDDNDEATFWRAAVRAAEGHMAEAAPDLARTGGVTRAYPRALRVPMGMLVAEAAIAAGDTEQSVRYVEALKFDGPNPAQKSRLALIEGRLAELGGDFDGAVARWEEAESGTHRPSRAKAAVARTELLLKLSKITRAEAIEELEKLRFAWRGDEFEFALLRRLGRLYMDEGDYRSGLRTLRQAATHFRKHEKAPEVTQEMADAFVYLYLEGGADKLAPVTAIALYDEFKELTPAGTRGDEMIRKLADRLVGVDLLDRAARLLEAQVRFRLKGADKARVGAQLALVHVLARDPDKAAEALKATEADDLPPELTRQRRHLLARALIGMEQAPDALALLEDDESLDADLLRVAVFWRAMDWPGAATVLKRLVRKLQAKPRQALNDRQGKFVLSLAIALTLSGEERAVGRVRRDYGAAMDTGPYRGAFRLIAGAQSVGLIDYRTVASRVGEVENFQAFLADYNERLREQKRSAVN